MQWIHHSCTPSASAQELDSSVRVLPGLCPDQKMSIPSGNQSLNCQQQLQNQECQLQQQTNHQDLDGRSPLAMDPVYITGMGAQQLTWYMHQQRQRPKDNNIEFWQKFVAEFFAPNAKKRWCVSLYGSSHAVIPQDKWHCELCNIKPSRGFEATAAILPMVYQVKYDSGTLEELLYVDLPHEYPNPSGQIVLLYEKAIQECVFEQLRIVRDGQLRIVFSPDLMIYSWEFCARNHEERIPRQKIIPQFGQLGEAGQKYLAAAQNITSSSPTQELESNSNMFVTSARQLAKAMEVPLVSDLGYTKRYVRCLQISDILNCMSDSIDYSLQNGTGATERLRKFIQMKNSTSQLHVSGQQTQGQHQLVSTENINNGRSSASSTSQKQLISGHNSTGDRNSVQLSTSNYVLALSEQNCTNSRNDNRRNYQIPSTGPSTRRTTSPLYPPAPLSPPIPSSANNPSQVSQSSIPEASPAPLLPLHTGHENSSPNVQLQQFNQSNEANPNESMSSVERIIQEVMALPQFSGRGSTAGGASLRNNQENTNGITHLSSNSPGSGTTNNGKMGRQSQFGNW